MSTFIEQLKERAKKDIKTIVLAEGEEIRTLKAAEMVKKEGYAKIILVGNPDKIKAMAAAENLDIDGIKIVDSENSEKNEEYANVFYELRKKKGITPEQAAETIKDPSYYAVMMVKQGDADGMVSGAIHSSADTIIGQIQRGEHNDTVPGEIFFNLFRQTIHFLVFLRQIAVQKHRRLPVGQALQACCLLQQGFDQLIVGFIFLRVVQSV